MVLLHPQSGRAVQLKRGTGGNGSGALYIAAEVSRNEQGSSESPVRPEGFRTESREGVAKKKLASRLEVSKESLPLQPANERAGRAEKRG